MSIVREIQNAIGKPSTLWFRHGFKEPFEVIKSVDIELTGKCNLNCKCCNHFSPIAEEGEVDVDSLSSDLKQLNNVLGGAVRRIHLLGGEPLLHTRIVEVLKAVREEIPDRPIMILSNGILLPKMSEEFWNVVKACSIEIQVTKYPISFDYEQLNMISKEKNVNIQFYGRSRYIQKTQYTLPIDVNGNNEIRDSFNNCYMARSCITMRDGKLYPCAYAAFIYRFNEFFKKDIPICEKDYADIYTLRKEDILHLLGNPIPLCAYCSVSKRTYGNKWGTSRRKIEEWT